MEGGDRNPPWLVCPPLRFAGFWLGDLGLELWFVLLEFESLGEDGITGPYQKPTQIIKPKNIKQENTNTNTTSIANP